MASSDENENEFGDLEVDDDAPQDDFTKATNYVRGCPGTFSDAELLYFYARYKQASDGVCSVAKPGFFDFAGRKKWEAWHSLGEMERSMAKTEYIDRLTQLRPNWMPKDGKALLKTGGGGMQVKVSRMAFDETQSENSTPPKTACEFVKHGDVASLKAHLLQNQAEVNAPDQSSEDKMAPLHWACDRGSHEIVAALLATPGINVNQRDSLGQTPLHYAASCDHVEIVKLLLAAPGVDPSLRDDDDCSPLEVASSDAVSSLLKQAKLK